MEKKEICAANAKEGLLLLNGERIRHISEDRYGDRVTVTIHTEDNEYYYGDKDIIEVIEKDENEILQDKIEVLNRLKELFSYGSYLCNISKENTIYDLGTNSKDKLSIKASSLFSQYRFKYFYDYNYINAKIEIGTGTEDDLTVVFEGSSKGEGFAELIKGVSCITVYLGLSKEVLISDSYCIDKIIRDIRGDK